MTAPDMDVLRILAENHPNLPTVSIIDRYYEANLPFGENTLHVYEELNTMNFKVRDISVYISVECSVRDGISLQIVEITRNRVLDAAVHWLDVQTENLVTLQLQPWTSNKTLTLPVFPRLTELVLYIHDFEKNVNVPMLGPFTTNHFPALEKLTFSAYPNKYNQIFAQAPLPSVHTFRLS